MVTVPALTPVTMPVEAPTVAVPVAVLLHVPPPVASVSVILDPAHTLVGPEIATGKEFTVKGSVV